MRSALDRRCWGTLVNRNAAILLAPHPADGRSMHRYADLFAQGFRDAQGRSAVTVSPPCVVTRLLPKRLAKWGAYFDKFILFAPRIIGTGMLRREVFILDHSNAIWALGLFRCRTFVVVHDVIAISAAMGAVPEFQPRWPGRAYQRLVVAGLRRAHCRISVSGGTQAAMLHACGLDSWVVYNPVSEHFRAKTIASEGASEPYLLLVSPPHWRKDRGFAIDIWLRMRRVLLGLNLIVVGSEFTDEESSRLMAEPALLETISFCPGVDDTTLKNLYHSAFATIVSSRYEGFGWPVVEAQSAGCPVIARSIPVLREVGGESLILIDAVSGVDWTTVCEVLTSGREALVQAGYENIERFSFDSFRKSIGQAVSGQG